LEAGEHDFQFVDLDEEEECEVDSRSCDIWEDISCMELLRGVLHATVDPLESKRARKRIHNYHWQGQSMYFKGLFDALLGPGVNPLEGSPNVKLRKVGTEGMLPTFNSRKG
jgi:hypothetical protein